MSELKQNIEYSLETVLDTLLKEGENMNGAMIESLDAPDLVSIFESIPLPLRLVVWRYIAPHLWWPVLHALSEDTARFLLKSLEPEYLVLLQKEASVGDLADMANVLPAELFEGIVGNLSNEDKADIEEALSYDANQVGRYLHRDSMRLRQHYTVETFWKILKKRGGYLPDVVYLIDKDKCISGQVLIHDLYHADDNNRLLEYQAPLVSVDHLSTLPEAARMISQNTYANWLAVMKDGNIIGTLAANQLLSDVRDHAPVSDIGSEEDDLFIPTVTAARRRAIWLTINLATAFLASWVIGFFELALKEIVALAILMPVVASMGGVAGSQTLTVAVKGIALNRLTNSNLPLLRKKELYIALINSVVLGVLIAFVTAVWFQSIMLGAIIFIAIIINGLAASLSGTYIPFILKKMHIDPSISGAVVLTTITDIVGFAVFLGLATVFLLGI